MRGGQRRLVLPRRLTCSSGHAHCPLLPVPCFLLHPSLPPPLSAQGWCPAPRPSSESSATSTGPCKGTEGTAPGRGPGSPGAGIAGASGAVFASVSSFLVSIFALLAQDSPRRAGCTARGCCRHAETICLCYQKISKEFFQLLVVPLLLLSAVVGFLLLVFDEENIF